MDISVVVNQVLMLFLPMLVGFFSLKIKIVNEHFRKNLSSLLFNITLPCTIISGLQIEFDMETLIRSGFIILISVIIVVFGWICGVLVGKALKLEGFYKNMVSYTLMFSNFSFMGYPVVQAFMGEKGLLYATMFSLPLYILSQSWGVALVDCDSKKSIFRPGVFLNPPLVAAVIGFLMFLTGWRFPSVINGTIRELGSMTTPLAMILSGLIIASESLKSAFSDWRHYILAVLRLVALPLAVFWIMKLIGINIDICRVSAIITMMPAATNMIILSSAYDKDSSFPANTVLLTTLLSIATIPLVGLLLF